MHLCHSIEDCRVAYVDDNFLKKMGAVNACASRCPVAGDCLGRPCAGPADRC